MLSAGDLGPSSQTELAHQPENDTTAYEELNASAAGYELIGNELEDLNEDIDAESSRGETHYECYNELEVQEMSATSDETHTQTSGDSLDPKPIEIKKSEIVNSNVELEDETVDLIKNIMTGIVLPDSAIPDWAKIIPEEKWMPKIVPETSQSNRM
ncbi:hypothetical protein BKA69DRAFT_835923 [Paraphysoderma sedebokerense]|nr:hypothetical protein BKA69DRAFT_835923 [Paraphysoderma sedebokerense]